MQLSKHLKGRSDPHVSDEKCVYVTKNDHFFKLCPGGQLGPHVCHMTFCWFFMVPGLFFMVFMLPGGFSWFSMVPPVILCLFYFEHPK